MAFPSGTTLFLRQEPHKLAIITEAESDNFLQYLADVRHQRDNPVVSTICRELIFVGNLYDDIFIG